MELAETVIPNAIDWFTGEAVDEEEEIDSEDDAVSFHVSYR